MEIISHRGYWLKMEERNTFSALTLALEKGYGIETDVRDIDGRLVISHDMPNSSKALYLEQLFEYYLINRCSATLALNIKSDGLQNKLKEMIIDYGINNYFVFDMSIPDTLCYLNHKINAFIRRSDFEYHPELMQLTDGIWADELKTSWLFEDSIKKLVQESKKVCIVSSELHGRDALLQWEQINLALKKIENSNNLMICTDKPDDAEGYFN